MSTRTEHAQTAILKILNDFDEPAGASRITERLLAMGVNLQPRTVRFYLLQMDRDGLTDFVSRRKGRVITERGREELSHSNVMEKVGFVAAKMDTLSYRMSLNPETGHGSLIANVAMLHTRDLSRAFSEIKPVFARRLGMGNRLALVRSSHTLAGHHIPGGSVALGTVCSVTLNSVLLAAGIPVVSKFGGLVEMRGAHPIRFVELIEYSGSTVDPLETFIRAGMTCVRECARTGNGIIGASFREIPSVALDDAKQLWKALERIGLDGVLVVGRPSQPLLDIPVTEGRTGIVVVGGLNPIAAVCEAGIHCELQSLSGLEGLERFSPFDEIFRRYMDSLR